MEAVIKSENRLASWFLVAPTLANRKRSWALIASLVETCKLNDVDPYAYLADTLTRIVNGHRASKIDDLLPWAYPKAPQLKDSA